MNLPVKYIFIALSLLILSCIYSVPSHAQSLSQQYQTARVQYGNGEFRKARRNLEEILKKDPSDTIAQKAHYFIGRILKESKREALQAIDHFFTVYSEFPRTNLTDDALYFIAQIYVNQLDQPEMALPYLKAVKDHFSQGDYHQPAVKLLQKLKKDGHEPRSKSVPLDSLPEPRMVLNFEKVDIKSLIKTYSNLTGKNFIYRPGISGKVTILGQHGIPVSQFHEVFMNILSTRGYTAIKEGDVYEVKSTKNALQEGVHVNQEQSGITTRYFHIGALPVKELKTVLETVLPNRKNYEFLKEMNLLLISTRPPVLDQVESMIKDLKGIHKNNKSSTMISYTPQYLSPGELSKKAKPFIEDLLGSREYRIMPVSTSNKLLIALPTALKQQVLDKLNSIDQDLSANLKVKVFRLDHAEEKKVVKKVRNLLKVLPKDYTTSNVKVVADQRQNAVIVSSVSTNIFSTIKDLITQLDKRAPERPKNIRVFKLEHADQKQVADKIRSIVDVLPGDYSTNKVKILPEERQNAIVVAAQSKQVFPVIKRIVEDLDKRKKDKPQRVRVYRLDHADEEKVAEALKKLVGVLPGQFPKGNIKIIPNERQRAVIVSAETTKVFKSVKNVIQQLDSKAASKTANHHVYKVKHSDAGPLAEKLNFLFKGKEESIRITSDEQTNSLIISAPTEKYESIKKTIQKLDNPKDLVMVEAYIVEASQRFVRNMGIQWGIDGSFEGNQVNLGTLFGLNQAQTGLNLGIIDDNSNNPVASARAFERKRDVKVLSTANLVASENQKASLNVGEIIPLRKNVQTTDEGTVNESFTFEEVGIQLEITPTVSGDSLVRMDILQKIDNVQPGQSGPLGAPTRTNREIKTKVAVENKQTLVLGGVIKDNKTNIDGQIPFLGDVPYLQHLFQSTQKRKDLTNLLVFLRPKILTNEENVETTTENIQQERNLSVPDTGSIPNSETDSPKHKKFEPKIVPPGSSSPAGDE